MEEGLSGRSGPKKARARNRLRDRQRASGLVSRDPLPGSIGRSGCSVVSGLDTSPRAGANGPLEVGQNGISRSSLFRPDSATKAEEGPMERDTGGQRRRREYVRTYVHTRAQRATAAAPFCCLI